MGLKGVDNYHENRNGFKYTKRMIVICNLIGFFIILIGAPIYLSLLSTPSNSLYEKQTIYTIFLSITCSFILIRICLSMPMYLTLFCGMNPMYSSNHEYERIDASISTQYHRRMQQQQHNNNSLDNYEETQEDRVQRQIRRQWRLMEMERR